MTDEQFTCAVRAYMDMVYRIALNYLKAPEEAEDVTQNVFLRLLRSSKSFASEEHLRYWLVRVAINECKRSLTSLWRKTEPLEDYADKLSFSSPEKSETYLAVMSLPRKYRMVIHLYYYEGYSTAEIAQLLHIPQSTVRTQLERGRKLLRERLEEAEHG